MSRKQALSSTALLLLLAGCQKPGAPEPAAAPAADAPSAAAEVGTAPAVKEPDGLTWTARSADGHALLTQEHLTGKCRISCAIEERPVWTALGPCLGEGGDWRFVANDCERSVVLIAAPPRSEVWRKTVVLRIFKRDGLDYEVMGIGALPDERLIRGSPSWVKGCFGVPGAPPRYSEDQSAVTFESIDGRAQSIQLTGSSSPARAPSPSKKKRRR